MINKLIGLMIGLVMSTALLAQNIPGALSVPGNLLSDDPEVMESLSPLCPGCKPLSPDALINEDPTVPGTYEGTEHVILWIQSYPVASLDIKIVAIRGDCQESYSDDEPPVASCVQAIPCKFQFNVKLVSLIFPGGTYEVEVNESHPTPSGPAGFNKTLSAMGDEAISELDVSCGGSTTETIVMSLVNKSVTPPRVVFIKTKVYNISCGSCTSYGTPN